MSASVRPVVLDTVALFWWTVAPDELPARATNTVARALARDQCLLSSISLWEIALKSRTGKLDLKLPIVEYARRVERMSGLRILGVDTATWLRNVALDWHHRDPADRTIVATAQLHDAELVTSDAAIRSYYPHSVWS